MSPVPGSTKFRDGARGVSRPGDAFPSCSVQTKMHSIAFNQTKLFHTKFRYTLSSLKYIILQYMTSYIKIMRPSTKTSR
jgi:hypothetical protein